MAEDSKKRKFDLISSDIINKRQISKVMKYNNALRSKYDWLINDEPKSDAEVKLSLQTIFGTKSTIDIQQDKILVTILCGPRRISGPDKGSKVRLSKFLKDREEAFQQKRYTDLPELDDAIKSIESDLKKPIIKEPIFKVRCFTGFFIIDEVKYLYMAPIHNNPEDLDSDNDVELYEG